MNIFEKVLLFHLIIQVIFAIIYLLWQFDFLDFSEETIQTVISFLNVFETIILVLTFFVDYGKWGVFFLGAWYILNTVMLILQFIFADWGVLYKIQNALWIALYIYLFFFDVFHIDLINTFFSRYGNNIMAFGESIKDTYWGDILKSVIIVAVKFGFNMLAKAKSD